MSDIHPLTNEIPEGLNIDEEKWLKIFTKKSLVATIVAFIIALVNYKFLSLYGFGIIGIVFGGILLISTYCVFTFHLPGDMTINGAGLSVLEYLIRRLIRRKNSVIYVKNYQPYEEVEEDV